MRYCHIEPFGRVALRNALDDWVYMAGKDKAADVLVSSSLHASRAARCHGRAESSAPGARLDTICLVREGAGMNDAVTERVGWSIRGGIDQDLRRPLRAAGLAAGPT